MRTRTLMTALLSALALLLGALVAPAPVHAQTNPYERGPAPTSSSLEGTGPFATSSTSVSNFSTPGFGAATIYYPTSTSSGTFGGVAIAPGFTATRSSVAWLGTRLASHGFVVIVFDTNSRYDQPASRGTQLLAALDYLTGSSSVRSRVDATRLAVMGHSMGGGGALEAAADRTSLQAAIPLTPWNTDKTWPEVRTPTMIIGAENDSVASVTSHAEPFYNSLSSATDKAYLELNGASHFAPNSSNPTISKYSVSWLKRFVDNDVRYEQFLCPPPPAPSSTIQEYRHTCPSS
jgi:predicted dienelactone hydrolase